MTFDREDIDLELALETSRRERGREGIEALRDWVDGDETRFERVWAIMRDGESRDSARAAWLVDHCLRVWPELLLTRQFDAFRMVTTDYPDAVHRALMNQLREIELDPELELPLFDLCIRHIDNVRSPVAVRCHSIFLGWKIAKRHPELRTELGEVIASNLPAASAGFRNRGTKVINWIEEADTDC